MYDTDSVSNLLSRCTSMGVFTSDAYLGLIPGMAKALRRAPTSQETTIAARFLSRSDDLDKATQKGWQAGGGIGPYTRGPLPEPWSGATVPYETLRDIAQGWDLASLEESLERICDRRVAAIPDTEEAPEGALLRIEGCGAKIYFREPQDGTLRDGTPAYRRVVMVGRPTWFPPAESDASGLLGTWVHFGQVPR